MEGVPFRGSFFLFGEPTLHLFKTTRQVDEPGSTCVLRHGVYIDDCGVELVAVFFFFFFFFFFFYVVGVPVCCFCFRFSTRTTKRNTAAPVAPIDFEPDEFPRVMFGHCVGG